jgi:hypothetical protein
VGTNEAWGINMLVTKAKHASHTSGGRFYHFSSLADLSTVKMEVTPRSSETLVLTRLTLATSQSTAFLGVKLVLYE